MSWGTDPPETAAPVHRTGGFRPHTVAAVPDRVDVATSTLRHARLADELAPMVAVWERLLETHLPDRSGRCRTCTQGGTGLPGSQWPCALHGLAELARRTHDRTTGD